MEIPWPRYSSAYSIEHKWYLEYFGLRRALGQKSPTISYIIIVARVSYECPSYRNLEASPSK